MATTSEKPRGEDKTSEGPVRPGNFLGMSRIMLQVENPLGKSVQIEVRTQRLHIPLVRAQLDIFLEIW
ncbi:hypothetical protein AAMO2058_001662700, partial [Amorphochlora amoebiformis]